MDDAATPTRPALADQGFVVPPLVRFSVLVRDALREAREEIDALNVYPVPDGDTGTNLFLTFEAAHQALGASLHEQGGEESARLAPSVAAYARGLLLGARGNSGVIMSQLVGALFRRIAVSAADPERRERPAQVFAAGMREATDAAYDAVGRPVEGTMLTVARAASDAASARVAQDEAARTSDVIEAAVQAAYDALARTPEQLEVLRRAGVVDAGGQGLCLVLDAALAAYTGRKELVSRGVQRRTAPRTGEPSAPRPGSPDVQGGDLTEGGPAYEVMYLLDAPDEAVPRLRAALDPLGDSLVVVGGEGLWNVHVHVDDVGAAIEAGIEVGRPYRIRITHFAEQLAAHADAEARRRTRAVVTVAVGDGLAALFREAGATVLLARRDARPSTGELLAAIRETGAGEVVLLPNAHDVVPTAEAAARIAGEEHGTRVAVVPTPTQVQGIAALAVHEPGRDFEQDLVEMSAAARHARSGAVTVAVRRAITTGGPCEPGDVLGAVEGDFTVVGADLVEVGVAVLERLLGGGGELVTLISGQGGDTVTAALAEHLARQHPTVDVLVYDGGQDRYPVLLGVE